MRKTLSLALTVLLLVLAGATAATAGKDKIYRPPSGQRNGKKIYIQPAKHIGGAKHGCKKYTEDKNMRKVGKKLAIYSSREVYSLTGRGYKVRLGGARTRKAPRRSNRWKSTLYVSLHSNGKYNRRCSGPPGGTQTYFKKGKRRARKVARVMHKRIKKESPGGRLERRKPTPDTSYIELNVSKRPAILLESEYHDWKKGVKFLKSVSILPGTSHAASTKDLATHNARETGGRGVGQCVHTTTAVQSIWHESTRSSADDPACHIDEAWTRLTWPL